MGSPEAMKISWTAAWPRTINDGFVTSVTDLSCPALGSVDVLCLDGSTCDTGDSLIDLNSNGSAFLPRARGNLTNPNFVGYTTTLCLCPSGNCLQQDLFTQQVGILHFFAVDFCLFSSASSASCIGSFSSLVGFYPIGLEVLCPSNLCADPVGLKITASQPVLPSWDPNNCGEVQTPMQTSPEKHGGNVWKCWFPIQLLGRYLFSVVCMIVLLYNVVKWLEYLLSDLLFAVGCVCIATSETLGQVFA